MTRYKGRPDAKSLARDFPHIVEMLLPPTGFGNRLNAMFDWHTANGIESQRGPERRKWSITIFAILSVGVLQIVRRPKHSRRNFQGRC
jgi:hypothetical protein